MIKKRFLSFSVAAILSLVSLAPQAMNYYVVVPVDDKSHSEDAIRLALSPVSLPDGVVGVSYSGFDFNSALRITGDPDPALDQVVWSVSSGELPPGLLLTRGGVVYGTPTEKGESNFQLRAKYKTKSVLGAYSIITGTEIHLINRDGVRSWEDGTYAQSCLKYRQPAGSYRYEGMIGDGIYRIGPDGSTAIDVYCDMTTEGGGWTLLMKQAKGDGTTLQGDTTYWVNGTVLNDTASNKSMTDENLVSAAFSRLPVSQFMLQAANESTVQKHTNASLTSAQVAFSNSNLTVHRDGWRVPQIYPDWFIRATKYPDGQTITTSRFGFNFRQWSESTSALGHGVRWGWTSNQNPKDYIHNGTHDVSGGLGAYGTSYGGAAMNNNKGAWQPATLYLWGK